MIPYFLLSSRQPALYGTLLKPDMNYSMSNSLAPPPTRGSAQSHPNSRLIYYFRCHKSSRCNCFALRWAELWREKWGEHFSISDSILLQCDCAPPPPFVALISDYWMLETTCLTLSVRLICLCLHSSINHHKLMGDSHWLLPIKWNLYLMNNAFELKHIRRTKFTMLLYFIIVIVYRIY